MSWQHRFFVLLFLHGILYFHVSVSHKTNLNFQLSFEENKRCTYSYQVAIHTRRGLYSTANQGYELHTMVDVTPVGIADAKHHPGHTIRLNVYQPRMRRADGNRGFVNRPAGEDPSRKLSKPFYFKQSKYGTIVETFYPRDEDAQVIALKKGIVSAFQVHLKSLRHNSHSEVLESDDSGMYLSKYKLLHSNDTHTTIERQWTNKDYIRLADGTPAKGEHKLQSQHTGTIHMQHGKIFKVHRHHKGVIESAKSHPRSENARGFPYNEDVRIFTSGYSKLNLMGCKLIHVKSRHRSKREAVREINSESEIKNLLRDDLVFKDAHKLNWKDADDEHIKFRSFFEVMRCLIDPTVIDSEKGECAREIHKQAEHKEEIYANICNLVLRKSHQNVTSWAVFISVIASRGDLHAQNILANALMSEYPRKLTLKEYESLLQGIFSIPKGPLHRNLFDALLQHARRDVNHGHQFPMAMLVLSGLAKRAETAGYNATLSDVVVELIHHSYYNKSTLYHPDSDNHEAFLRNHIWAFGNLGHISGLNTMLEHANHDSSGIRSAVVSGMRKLPADHTKKFLLDTLYSDEHNDVKTAVIEVFIERHEDLSDDIVKALEHAIWHAEDNSALDETIQTFLDNHYNHPKAKHIRKRRHILMRQKRALIPALKPREFSLGQSKRWAKKFGNKYLGAETILQFQNQVKLRIGLFGGSFEVDLDNHAKFHAHLWKWGFDIVKGKAAFKASASFKNDIPKDLIHAVADVGDDILKGVDGFTDIIVVHIEKFKAKFKTLIPLNIEKLLDFNGKIGEFLKNLIQALKPVNLMENIITLAKTAHERMENWRLLLNKIEKIQTPLTSLTNFDSVFKKVIDAVNKIMNIIGNIKLKLPNGLPPNFKIETLLEWLKSTSIDLHDHYLYEFFKSFGAKDVPKTFSSQFPFRFSMHFSSSMDNFVEICLKTIKFANNVLGLSTVLDSLERIQLPLVSLPRLEGKFPLHDIKSFNFGLSFDWRLNLRFDLNLKQPHFLHFLKVLEKVISIFKQFDLPSFHLETFFLDIMPNKALDLSKIFETLLQKRPSIYRVNNTPPSLLQNVLDKVLDAIDETEPNITAVSDITDFFKELGPSLKEFTHESFVKICKIHKIALNTTKGLNTFGENFETNASAILKMIENTTQNSLQEFDNYTIIVDKLIDKIEKNFTSATRGFVSGSLMELSQSLEELQNLANVVVDFANETASRANGVCNKVVDFSADVIDNIQNVSRQVLAELTSFIGPVSQNVKSIGQDLKKSVDNIENWYRENLEVGVGKIAKIARYVADLMSILNTKKGFLGEVHDIAQKVNTILTHMKNIPVYAQKARETADDIISFAGIAQNFKDNIAILDVRKEFHIDFDKRMRDVCNAFNKMASGILNKVHGDDIVDVVHVLFNDAAHNLVLKASSNLRRIKQPIQDVKEDLQKTAMIVGQVKKLMDDLKPFNKKLSSILTTIHKLPDCQQILKISRESIHPCVKKAMISGMHVIDQYKDMRKEIKVLYDMIPETWKNLKIQKCYKGSTCISKSFIGQARIIQEKVERLKNILEQASGFTNILGSCKAGLDNLTHIIDTVKLLIQQKTGLNICDDTNRIKTILRNLTGTNIEENASPSSVRYRRSLQISNTKIKPMMEYVLKAKNVKEKLRETLKNTFRATKSTFDDIIFEYIQKIEAVNKKIQTSYHFWKKSEDTKAIIQGLGNVVNQIIKHATKITGITNAFSSPVERLLTDTGELSGVIKPYMDKYISIVKEAIDKINGFFQKVTDFQNKIQLRQRGLDLSEYKDWSAYPYCSADICLRSIRRSSSLYYNTIFTWKFPHLDDLSSMNDAFQRLTPGLFDDYKVAGITQLSESAILLGMYGVSRNKGKASVLVVTDIKRNAVKKIILLGSHQSPFNIKIGGVTVAKETLWISDSQSKDVHCISKGSVISSMSTRSPSWIQISKTYSVEGVATSVSFDEKDRMLWVTDGKQGKGYGYRLTPSGDLFAGDLAPDKVIVINKDARGMVIVRQFNTEYVVVSRCVLRPGFQCKLEFHDLTDGSEINENSLSRVVRTPTGLESIDKATNDLLVIVFSSGTYSEKDKIDSVGGNFEDRYFRIKLPVLKMSFSISENCLMLKFMGDWIISPRRIIPIGDLHCGSFRKRSIESDYLDADVYSKELEEIHRRNKRSTTSSCTKRLRGNAVTGYQKFMPDFNRWFFVYGIPIRLFVSMGGYWYVDYQFQVCIKDRIFKVGLIPGATIRVHAGVSVLLFIVEVGITVEANILETALIPELAVKIDKWPLKACIELKVRIIPIRIRIFFWYRFFCGIDIRCGILWCKLSLRWTSKRSFWELTWSAPAIVRPLFKNCDIDKDTTPPIAGLCSARQVGDKTYFVQWHGFKEDRAITNFWINIGSISGSGDDYGANVGTSLSVVVRDLPIMEGRDVFASVRATNEGGLSSRLSLCPVFQAKRSGPLIRYVFDGSKAEVDKDYQSDAYSMGVNFAWSNHVQKIIDVKWGISTNASCTFNEGKTDAYGPVPVGETSTIQTSGLSLKHGTKYYTRIIATNSIGLRSIMCSDGITVDTTPPVPGVLFDGAGEEDKNFIPSTKRVQVTYGPFSDEESPMVRYEWKVIQYLNLKPMDVTPFVNIPLTQKTPLMENLNLELGQKYHIILRGTNAAGLQATKQSDGFIADNTSPICNPILDVLSANDTEDVDFVRQLTSIQAKWNCVDDESGIIEQLLAVGTYPGGDDVKAFVNVSNISYVFLSDNSNYLKIDDIEIKPKVRYHVTIRAYNGAGLRRTVTSDGILIDTTPPTVALQYIKDGVRGKDVNYTKERFAFNAHWEQAFVDAESGIAEYRIGLGTSPGLFDVQELISVGNQTKGTFTGLILNAGKKYYVTVVGCNGVEMCINGSSNGAMVDYVPPHTGDVITGFAGPPIRFQWIAKSVWARWKWCPADQERTFEQVDSLVCKKSTFYDVHSGITTFGLSVTSLASEKYLDGFKEVGRVQMSGRSINLNDGVYSVVVRAKDKAGMTADGFSNTFIVDSSPAKITKIQHGHENEKLTYSSKSEHTFTAYFVLEDDLSRIFAYKVYVGSYPGADDVSSTAYISLQKPSYIFAVNWTAHSSSKLENNRKYYVTALALNGAGLVGSASSEAFFTDTEPPRHAIVLDGWGFDDVNYQSYSSIYRAHWYGLVDFTGIQSIYLGLTSSPAQNNCDVKDFEAVPNNLNYHILSGLKLKSGSKYYARIKVIDNAQNIAYFTSNGVLVDSSPPVPGQVFNTDITGVDIATQTEDSILWASWKNFKETETAIAQYLLSFGTAPGKNDVQEFTNVGLVLNSASTRLKVSKLANGQRYYATVAALNILGIQSTPVSSNGVMVDSSPPIFTNRVSHGASSDMIEKYTSGHLLSVSWKCSDNETGLDTIRIAFGLQPGSNDVMNFTSIPVVRTSYVLNTNLKLGIRYFATVICTNKVGLKSTSSSNGIVYDDTPPSGRFVRKRDYQNSTMEIALSWNFYDIESGISKYEIFAVNSDFSVDQGPYEFSEDITSALITLRRPIKTNVKYYINVTAYNGVGMISSLMSNGFIVDNTPPKCDNVWPGDKTVQHFIGLSNTLAVSWNCFENETAITRIRFAVQDMITQDFVIPFYSTKEKTISTGSMFITSNGKWLPKYKEGSKYRVGVELTNTVNLKSIYWTNGVVVDRTPPVVNNLSLTFSPINNTLIATWNMKDDQSGIALIKCGLGSTPDTADIISLHTIDKNDTSWNITKAHLQNGFTYFVFVVVTDAGGSSTEVVSDGVVIDRSPPSPGIVQAQYILPTNYDRNKSTVAGVSISITWTGFADLESGIVEYSFSMGHNFELITTLDDTHYTKIPFGGAQIKNLTLSENTTYCICVRATNGVGLQRTDCSKSITITLKQIIAGVVSDGPRKQNGDLDFQLDDRALWAFWDGFQDPESGISSYDWCISDRINTVSGSGNCMWPSEKVLHPKNYAHRFYKFTLAQGTKYYVTVTAFNKNGESVTATSDGITVDRSPPVTNSLTISPSKGKNTLYMNSLSPPTITWDMDDKECGISHFMIGIGSFPWQDDLTKFQKINRTLRCKNLNDINFTMTHSLSLYVTILGYNMLGLESSLTTQQIIVDLTPPSPGLVFDGNQTEENNNFSKDIDFQTSKDTISAQWVDFMDAESGIQEYRWCIGSKQASCDVMKMKSIGMLTSSNTRLKLYDGLCYFVTVEATNGAGLTMLSSSNGVCIETSPPTLDKVVFVQPRKDILMISKSNMTFQSNSQNFKFTWENAHEGESGISFLQYCLGEKPGSCNVIDWRKLEKDTKEHHVILDKPLLNGTTIYVSLKITNKAGLYAIRHSDALIIDESPPKVGTVIVNVSQEKYIQNSINGIWRGFEDKESDVEHYAWTVCLAVDHEECLTDFINVGLTTKLNNDELDLKPGVSYVLIIRAFNKVGLFSSAVSNIFIIDDSRLTPGEIFDGADISKDLEVQSSTSTISANWKPFKSKHSIIMKYEMCIGNRPLLCNVHEFQSFGNSLEGEISALNLTHLHRYYITIRATNEGGLTTSSSSNGIIIDQTPPVGWSVRDGSGADDIDLQAHGSFVSANWDQFIDDETVVVKYIWCAGTSRGACDVVQDTEISAGDTKAHVQVSPPIVHGVTVFIKLSAVNGAGGITTVYSNGVTIDSSPPQITQVYDLETNGSLAEVDFLTSKTKYCSSWNAIDFDSGIDRIEVSVCMALDNSTCLAKTVDVRNLSLVCMFNLNFLEGVKYVTMVRAYNKVGLTAIAYSDGFIFDYTSPLIGSIDVGHHTLDVTQSQFFASSVIDVNWNGFWDKETSIARYYVCLGNQSGSCDVAEWKDVGLQTFHRFDYVDLVHASTYYASVKAENRAGLKSIVTSSEEVFIDKTAPIKSPINNGNKQGTSIKFQRSVLEVHAYWNSFEDPESDITSLTYCISSHPGGSCDILPKRKQLPTINKMHEVLQHPMKTGQTFYVTVQATNGAGLITTVMSDAVVVDTTPPLAGRVFDGNSSNDIDYIHGDDDVVANWVRFKDDESGIKSYEIAICKSQNITDCPQSFTNVNNATTIKIAGLDLESGTAYIAIVRATNYVDLVTEVSSNGFTVDFTPPITNVAWIGPGKDHVKFQKDNQDLHVSWLPFSDDESGIANYELCIQAASSSECKSYVSVGRKEEHVFLALSLEHGKTYFVIIKATNGVGMTVFGHTSPVTVDMTPPVVAQSLTNTHVRMTFNEEIVNVDWDEFKDPESGLSSYKWCVGTSRRACDLVPKISSEGRTSGSSQLKNTTSNTSLFATVFISNTVGLTKLLYSKEYNFITVNPNITYVDDLNSLSDSIDVDWTSNVENLSFKWAVEHISAKRIEVAITSLSNRSLPRLSKDQNWNGELLLQKFTMANPKQPNITIATVPIAPWEEYRGVVRVWNERGIYRERSSDGVRIEPSPPLPRQVVLRNSAVENETSRWLPNLHLPSFNLTGFDPDVTYVSSPDDITIAVSDFSDGTNSSYVKLNKILDSGAFSPTKEFKLLVTRILSDANETNTTEQNLETKTLSGFADPSGPCCADHTPNWLKMNSDIHYKPTTTTQEFGSSVVQLPNDYVVVSSIHKLFFFSKKDRTKNKVVFLGNDKIVNGLSYSDGDLIASCSDRINVYKLQSYDDINLQLVTSISNCKNHHCGASDVKWSELDKGLSIIQNKTIIAKGKTEPHNYSVIGVFRKDHSLRWKLVKCLGESDNSHRFGSSFAVNGKFLAVLSNLYTVNIYSTINFSRVMQIGLHSYRNIFKPDLGLSQDNALILVSRSRGHIVVLHLNYTAKSSHKVCSYFVPSDIRLSGNFDFFGKDNGTVIALGMQTARGLDGVILTSFYGTSPYHPYHQNGKCLGLGQILSRERSLRVDDGIPRASVSVKGSTILFGAPGVLTWPDGSEKQGTGRVYSMVFCPKNYKRVRISNIKGQEAFQCEPCENGRKSLGAITRICEICKERRCASYLDDDPIHFATEICNSSQCPLVKRFNNKTNAITTIPENGSFFEEGVSNEYVIKLVETTRAGISTTSMSKPFIIDTSSPTVGTVYDGLDSSSDKNCSNNETLGEHSQCSTRDFMDTDIDYTHNATEVHARWIDFADNESDIAEYFFCIGSKPMLDDIRQCQSTGLRQNASEYGFDFKQGDKYYVTVVACNGAQRCSAGHSNGVTVDTTPPVMQYVRDGVMGSDIDYQVFLDLLFVHFKANDSESGIRSYEVAWGTEPGLVDLKDYEEILNTTVWFSEYKNNKLKKHKKYYATVRAANKAGLLSDPMSSDGVQVGKSEYLLGSNDSASFFFDTVNANPNGTRRDGGVGKTYGTLKVPKGALKDEVKLTCYSLDQKTLESNSSDDGPVSNPEKTKPKQFMLGNYSFQIKAIDPKNNTVREGYKFVKPIKISMFYDVDNLVNANKRLVNKELEKEDIDPVLYLWDLKNKTWMDASLTCPEPWSYVNRSIKLLTVKICHLTQFAFYWMFKAQNGLMMFDKNTSVYDNDGGINIVQQSSVQQVNLPVKRSKGSRGHIEVSWSSHSNVSDYNKIIWPLSGTISFQEGQWNSTIVVSVASNDYPTLETFIWVHLDSTTGGALIASEDLTTTKLTITSAQASTVKSFSNKWVVTGVSLGLIVLLILIVVIVIRKRNKLAEIMRNRRKAGEDNQASNRVQVEMSAVNERENKGFQSSLENIATVSQTAPNLGEISAEASQDLKAEVPEHTPGDSENKDTSGELETEDTTLDFQFASPNYAGCEEVKLAKSVELHGPSEDSKEKCTDHQTAC